jgi:prepilin-type N-terminal cleavage/methylation domain-containing protein
LSLKNQYAFTLIELMIVVAIIGVLASVSMSKYQIFAAKARTAEAKINLGASYWALQSYSAENNTYTGCLTSIGFTPEGSKRFFTVGFDTTPLIADNCGPVAGDQDCRGVTWNAAGTATATCAAGGAAAAAVAATTGISTGYVSCPIVDAGSLTSTSLTQTTFVVAAMGCISDRAGSYDRWEINQVKLLKHTNVGY